MIENSFHDFTLNYTCPYGIPTLVPTIELEKRLDLRLSHRPVGAADKKLSRWVVHLHIYYIDCLGDLLSVLGPACSGADLIVTTDSLVKSDIISAEFLKYGLQSIFGVIQVLVVPNGGRNVRPLLQVALPFLLNYELALHLHTKQSKHGADGPAWLNDLLDCLVASKAHVDQICQAFVDMPNLGVVIPRPAAHIRRHMNWGRNFEIAQLICQNVFGSRRLEFTAPLIFPAGMMFWFRPRAIQPLREMLNLWDKAAFEPLPVDGTYLHAIERLVAHSCEETGFKWALISSPSEAAFLDQCSSAGFSVWEPRVDEYIGAVSKMASKLRDIEQKSQNFEQNLMMHFGKRIVAICRGIMQFIK